MLVALTVLLGLVIVGTRLPGALRPELARRMARRVLGGAGALRLVGAGMLVYDALLLAALQAEPAPYTVVMYVLFAVLLLAGLVFAWGPSGLTRLLLDSIRALPDTILRAMCVSGVVIGLGLIAIGWFVYQ